MLLLHWIVPTLEIYGGVPLLGGVLTMTILSIYLGGFWALFLGSIQLIRNHVPVGLSICAPAVWCATEGLRGWLLTGFPWAPLGNALWQIEPLIQVADITGVWGLSFLLVLINVSLYELIRATLLGQGVLRGALVNVSISSLLIVSALGYGYLRMGSVTAVSRSSPPLVVGVAQGNIEQSLKWDPAYREATLRIYRNQTMSLARKGAGLVVWPESAAPVFLPTEKEWMDALIQLGKNANIKILLGALAAETRGAQTMIFNRVYLLDQDLGLVGHYDKVHLVPFGEYIPLRRFMFFLKKLIEPVGDITPGREFNVLRSGEDLRIGVSICFESIFPGISRTFTANGAVLLANLTNDAWFGDTPGPYQHLSHAVMRAVENRRWLVRAANTGISAIIDPTGKIVSALPLMKRKTLIDTVRLLEIKSLYTRWGDWFLYACMAFGGAAASFALFKRWRRKRNALT